MSTTARKARKGRRRAVSVARNSLPELYAATAFMHPVKTGTPVPNRQENQPFVHVHGATGKPVFVASAKAKRRLAEYEARTAAATRGGTWPDHRRASRAA